MISSAILNILVKVLQITSVRNPHSDVRNLKPFCKVPDWNLLVTNLTNETFVLEVSSDVRGMDPIMELKHRALPLAIHIGGEWMKDFAGFGTFNSYKCMVYSIRTHISKTGRHGLFRLSLYRIWNGSDLKVEVENLGKRFVLRLCNDKIR